MSYTLTSSPTIYAASNGFKYNITCAEGVVISAAVTGSGSYSIMNSGSYISGGSIATYLTAPVQLSISANISIASPVSYTLALVAGTTTTITATSSNFSNGQTVVFTALANITSGITTGVDYYVVGATGSTTFSVAATQGGTPISIVVGATPSGSIQLSANQSLNTNITLSPLSLSGHLIPAPYGQSISFPLSNLVTLPPTVAAVNVSTPVAGYAVTGTASSKVFTVIGSTFSNGSQVVFNTLVGGTALKTGITYGVINASGPSFQLALPAAPSTAISLGTDLYSGSYLNQVQVLDTFLQTIGGSGHHWDYSPATGIVSCASSDLGGGVPTYHTPTPFGLMLTTTPAYGNDNGSGGTGSYFTIDTVQIVPGVNPTVSITDGTNQITAVSAITGVPYSGSSLYTVVSTAGSTISGSFTLSSPSGMSIDGSGHIVGTSTNTILGGTSSQFPFSLSATSTVTVSTETVTFKGTYGALLNLYGQSIVIIGPNSASTNDGVPVNITVQTSPPWSVISAAGLTATISASGLSPDTVTGNVITVTPTLLSPSLMQVLVGSVTATLGTYTSPTSFIQLTVLPTAASNVDIDIVNSWLTLQNNRNAATSSNYDALVTYLSLNKMDTLHSMYETAIARFCGQTAQGDWFPTYSRYNSTGPIQDGDSLAQSIKRLQTSKNQNLTIYEPGGLKATAINPTPDHVVIKVLTGFDDDIRISLVNGSTVTTLFDNRRYGTWASDNANILQSGLTYTINAGSGLSYHLVSPGAGSLPSVDISSTYALISGTTVQIDTFNALGPTTNGGLWTGTVFWTDGSSTTYSGGGLGGNGRLTNAYFPNGSFSVASDWYNAAPSSGSTLVPSVGVTNPSQLQIGNSLNLTVVDQVNGVLRLDTNVSLIRGLRATITPVQTRLYTVEVDATVDWGLNQSSNRLTVYPTINGTAVSGAQMVRLFTGDWPSGPNDSPLHLCFQVTLQAGSLYTLGIGLGVSQTTDPAVIPTIARVLSGSGSTAYYPPANYSNNELVSSGTCTYDPTWKIT